MVDKKLTGFEVFANGLNSAKVAIASVAFIITSLIGGYQLFTKYVVTVAYADELVKKAVGDVEKQIVQIKKTSETNRQILIEMRMIRLENKMYNKHKLTPTEKRVYDKLKKQYIETK